MPFNTMTAITSILVIIARIYRYQFKCNGLTHQRHFVAFLLFLESTLNFQHFEKKVEP